MPLYWCSVTGEEKKSHTLTVAGSGQNSPVCVGGGAGFLRISEVLNNNCVSLCFNHLVPSVDVVGVSMVIIKKLCLFWES